MGLRCSPELRMAPLRIEVCIALETRCCRELLRCGNDFQRRIGYDRRMMDEWLNIPKDRKSISPVRLTLILGVTALIFLMMLS